MNNSRLNNLRQKARKKIKIDKLNFKFKHPPLLVAGIAMMYYGLRESDKDIDFILSRIDHQRLAKNLHGKGILLEEDHKAGYKDKPQFVDLYGDHGILIYEFELWDNIMHLSYDDLEEGAIKENNYLVISLEKLLFLCCVRGAFKERYLQDAILIAKKISQEKYKNYYHQRNFYWKELFGK